MPAIILDHPLAKVWMSQLRDCSTQSAAFRTLTRQLSQALLLEALKDKELETYTVKTPIEETTGYRLAKSSVLVPILRAGIGMVEPILEWLPDASVGYLGLERDETTAVARRYYSKFPNFKDQQVLVLDPMLATGGSAIHAVKEVQKHGGSDIRFLCMVAAPEGIQALQQEFPGISIYAACKDRQLNEQAYIMPGLGDFGDRLFNT